MELFKKALPIWINSKENEVHLRVQFKAIVKKASRCIIKIATSGIYNLWINNVFVCYGPARAGKGYFRLDEIEISEFLNRGKNVIVIEVAGYNTNSFAIQNQLSFVQAEIICNDEVMAYTGKNFTARMNPYYYRKVQRYSFQRPMIESYHYDVCNDDYYTNDELGKEELTVTESKNIIPRYVSYPKYETSTAEFLGKGNFLIDETKTLWRDRSNRDIGNELIGYKIDELEIFPTDECSKLKFLSMECNADKCLNENQYSLYKLSHESAGFLELKVRCNTNCRMYILFDEILSEEGTVDFRRMDCANVIRFDLCKGEHDLKLFDVYCMQYIQIVLMSGVCEVSEVDFIEYKHPPVKLLQLRDEKLQKIAIAATETYRQNAVDIFMDCPSRERAGWLCDSFFTARTEYFLTGKSVIEKSFLENFLCEDEYYNIPKGMLPMCYPADFYDGNFIPQWSLWLVLELGEYYKRSQDYELIEKFRSKINSLFLFFERYENSDSLLEDLPGWNFVEWSKANNFVNGVNYPTNMLYVAALSTAGELYDEAYSEKARKIKQNILEQSFNGTFFVDNAIRKNGKLELTDNISEVCQYYAFFLNIATKESHNKLFNLLMNDFGPHRDYTKTYCMVHPAAPFIGYFLRLDILSQVGRYDELKENIESYYYNMACKTGTLWEHADTRASCSHGFSSYILCWLEQIRKQVSGS